MFSVLGKIATRRYVIALSTFILSFFIVCAGNIIASRYYRLLEKERKIFLGLRAIDSVAAYEYLNLPSPTERAIFYRNYWGGKEVERQAFEKRAEYAFKEFGRYAPLDDERVLIYVKYGEPNRRYTITPEKRIGIASKEFVRPAEIWTYKSEGIEYDFVKIGRAFKIIVQSTFGDSVIIPYLKEQKETLPVVPDTDFSEIFDFDMAIGRFRQTKNLTRLELYSVLPIKFPTDCSLFRVVRIYNEAESLITEKKDILIPSETTSTTFYDEINCWLPPAKYKVLVEYFNLKAHQKGKQIVSVNLIEYKEDARKISDLIFAKLIDNSFSDEKFYKPPGRVIPLVNSKLPKSTPFYLYHEIYNLTTREGMHSLKTVYEIYNKEKMRKEIVDVMVQSEICEGDIAYLAAKYHPMDLPAGEYIIVARSIDLFTGEEYSTLAEFTLEDRK